MAAVMALVAVAPIVGDSAAASKLFGDVLGMHFYQLPNGYVGTEQLDGITHFGLWPLQEAARACFGTDTWPSDLPTPQASVEFAVDDVTTAAATLAAAGCRVLEPTGDEHKARLLTSDGLVVILSDELIAGG